MTQLNKVFRLSLLISRRVENLPPMSFAWHFTKYFSDWHLPVLPTALCFWLLFSLSYYNTSTLLQPVLLSQVAPILCCVFFSLCWSEIFEFCLRWIESCWYYNTAPISELSMKSNPAPKGACNPSQLSDSHKYSNIFAIQVVNENI